MKYGADIDNITLVEISINPIPELISLSLAATVAFPLKLMGALRCAYLLLDDLWLYNYNDKNYTGLVQTVFTAITTIQLLKF